MDKKLIISAPLYLFKNSSVSLINTTLWHYLGTKHLITPGVLIEEIRHHIAL